MMHGKDGKSGQRKMTIYEFENKQIDVYRVEFTKDFDNDMKYYIKKKKYRRLPKDIKETVEALKRGDFKGTRIEGLGFNQEDEVYVYKERVSNSDTNSGTSNGYRLIYYVRHEKKLVYLLTVYSKKDDIRVLTDSQIKALVLEIIKDK